jgi:hypothetical protein
MGLCVDVGVGVCVGGGVELGANTSVSRSRRLTGINTSVSGSRRLTGVNTSVSGSRRLTATTGSRCLGFLRWVTVAIVDAPRPVSSTWGCKTLDTPFFNACKFKRDIVVRA